MSAQQELEKYLEKIRKDISTGITLKKFYKSATDKIEIDGKLHFQMERHSRALGAQYYEESPMAAYTTRIEKYMFDPDKEQIIILDVSEETINPSKIDYSSLATEHLSGVRFNYIKEDDGSYLMKEKETGFSAVISDESAIEDELWDFASELNLDYDPRFDVLPEDQRDIVLKKLEAECNVQAIQKAKQDWIYNRDS